MSAGGDGTSESGEPSGAVGTEAESAADESGASTGSSGEVALLGQRRDLSLTGSPPPRCKCLAVVVGAPGNSAFRWSGARPRIDPSTQLVVTMTSEGVACPEAGSASGASYSGYEVEGNDVVVIVENAVPGRPVAQGAIIPKPTGGRVYVRPARPDVVYGRPLRGEGDRCEVGGG